jgi:hypothetical protein
MHRWAYQPALIFVAMLISHSSCMLAPPVDILSFVRPHSDDNPRSRQSYEFGLDSFHLSLHNQTITQEAGYRPSEGGRG